MLAELRRTEPIVAATFDEADAIMRPLLGGRALSDIIFVGPEGVAEAEAQLMRTEITQPAVLTVDIALTRLLAAYGIEPDFVMGHSLGEYGALVAAGVLSFAAALEAVSARGREMANLTVERPGRDGRRLGAARRGRADRRGDRRLRRPRQRQLDPPARARRRRPTRSSRRSQQLVERGAPGDRGCRSATRSTPRSSPPRQRAAARDAAAG